MKLLVSYTSLNKKSKEILLELIYLRSSKWTKKPRTSESSNWIHDKRINPVSCHNRSIIPSPTKICPIERVGQEIPPKYRKQERIKLAKRIYTSVNKRDINSNFGDFFNLWPHLKAKHKAFIKRFIISRRYRIHQEHSRILLTLYCGKVLLYVKG